MALTPFSKDMGIIAKLDDEPNDVGGLTAAELKAKFDEGGKALGEYLNDTLLPELEDSGKDMQNALNAKLDADGGMATNLTVADDALYFDDGTALYAEGWKSKFSIVCPDGYALQYDSGELTGLSDPTAPESAATKSYVDTGLSGKLSTEGGIMTGDVYFPSGCGFTFCDEGEAERYAIDNGSHEFLFQGYEQISVSGATISGVATPQNSFDAATKGYVDTGLSGKLDKSGGTMTGALTLADDPTSGLHAATKGYVDEAVTNTAAGYLPLAGGELSGGIAVVGYAGSAKPVIGLTIADNTSGVYGELSVDSHSLRLYHPYEVSVCGCKLIDLMEPKADSDAATKGYVDEAVTNTAAGYLPLTGGVLEGTLVVNGADIELPGMNGIKFTATPNDPGRIYYRPDAGGIFIDAPGGTVRFVTAAKLMNLLEPKADSDAATKGYVDSAVSSACDRKIYYLSDAIMNDGSMNYAICGTIPNLPLAGTVLTFRIPDDISIASGLDSMLELTSPVDGSCSFMLVDHYGSTIPFDDLTPGAFVLGVVGSTVDGVIYMQQY